MTFCGLFFNFNSLSLTILFFYHFLTNFKQVQNYLTDFHFILMFNPLNAQISFMPEVGIQPNLVIIMYFLIIERPLLFCLAITKSFLQLQEKIKKLREDWQYVKNRGDPSVVATAEVDDAVAVQTAAVQQARPSGESKI